MIIKDSLLVEELTDDMIIDDLLVKYDDSSAYMFGKVKDGNKTLINKLREYIPYGDIIISFNRVNKTPYRGLYRVDMENIFEVFTAEDYEKLKKGELRWEM